MEGLGLAVDAGLDIDVPPAPPTLTPADKAGKTADV